MSEDWLSANQRALAAELNRVRNTVARHLGLEIEEAAADSDELEGSPALDHLVRAFRLTPFERDVLLLAAGPELDARFSTLFAKGLPSFSLALAALEQAHWNAAAPDAPLRYWQLIHLGNSDTLVAASLRLDERILHHLTGTGAIDMRLAPLLRPLAAGDSLASSHRSLALQICEVRTHRRDAPLLILTGQNAADQFSVAATAAALLGCRLFAIDARDLPSTVIERDALVRIWERETALSNVALLIDTHEADAPELQRAAAAFAENANGLVLIAGREALKLSNRPGALFAVPRPKTEEQQILWREALGEETAAFLNGQIERVASQFQFGSREIERVAAELQDAPADSALAGRLWSAARLTARNRLEALAQRIEPHAGWDDLVLPEAQTRLLKEIAKHVRQRFRVHEEWGFAKKSGRGLGISALFAGQSGTGKTMAAEVLAAELHLDVFRIDLSAVVSKYIGETEKNLRRVFDAAESGGSVLLFDEADALFGKRGEVKESHDRYANLEVSYLLQRMECYRGLAILTTNLKDSLDPAFLRRLRFIVHFPFPDAAQRTEIWRRIFPKETPVEGLDMARLSRLNLPGGNLQNIALGAAFLAADSNEPVRMCHILEAARSEYGKLEKNLTDSEAAGWI